MPFPKAARGRQVLTIISRSICATQTTCSRAIGEMRQRLEVDGSRLDALVNNAGISPKMDGGGRMSTLDTSRDDWATVFQVNFFAPIMLARGLIDELKVANGSVVNVTSIVGSRVHPFAGAAYATSKAALSALTREMALDFGPFGDPRQRHFAGRNRDLDPVAGNGEDCRDNSPAPARPAGRSGQGDLFPVHRAVELHHRRRTPYQWRSARLSCRVLMP